MRTYKIAAANTRLASCGVTCLDSSSVFQLGFSAGLTVLCSKIPHERQAWERCTIFYLSKFPNIIFKTQRNRFIKMKIEETL